MDLVRYSDEEWSALYIDGKLDIVGDHYLIDNRISELFGVEVRDSDEFMQGGNRREDVAQTLEEAEAYGEKEEESISQAAALRAEAEELRRRAAAIEQLAAKQ